VAVVELGPIQMELLADQAEVVVNIPVQ
jgi:hypothetical protein